MSFRLFGVDVEIQIGFWIGTVLLGLSSLRDPPRLVIWVAVVLFSVLLHEFGHAFAIKRHKIEPEISLHWMGGTTTWRMVLPLTRIDKILISLAGPFSGFAFGALVYAFRELAPEVYARLPELGRHAVRMLLWVNIGWGIVNLLPVLPFDGGHVLEEALGPKRVRMTAAISFLVGGVVAFLFLVGLHSIWGFFIFGLGAYQSYQRFRNEVPVRRSLPPPASEPPLHVLPPTAVRGLEDAKRALAEDRPDDAMRLAQDLLAQHRTPTGAPDPRVAHAAMALMAWAHVLAGRLDEAETVLAVVERLGPIDPALAGAYLLARGKGAEARRVLEAARATGDDRKEVVGPLIQILLADGETARAAAVAFDIVDALSEDDARRMAELAFDGRAYDWSARLWGAVFERTREGNDAYGAARAHAMDGQHERAIDALRAAVDAGFSDRARAWSDVALEALRAGRLETVVPRP